MNANLLAATALSGLSILLLLGLLAVWVDNYRTFGSSLTLGLVAFAGVLLVENVVAIYFFFSTNMLYASDPVAQQALLAMRALELAAIAFLTYVTMQ